MKAAQIVEFGPPSVITNDDLPRPGPGPGQLLVRVKAAGVGNWDALIREGKVRLHPLTANSNRYRATQTATTDELRFLDETA